MSLLSELRDHVKTLIVEGEAEVSAVAERAAALVGHKDLLAKIEAEMTKVPSFDDLRALVDQIASGTAHTS